MINKTFRDSFDSIDAFMRFVENAKSPSFDSTKTGSTFHELPDWQTTIHHLRNGWQKGIDAVNAKTSRLEREIGSSVLRETFNPATQGQFFDVGLVLSGEPECWLETNLEDQGSKVVTIAINSAISSAISRSTFIERGSAICALVKILEANGKSVRVVLGMGLDINFDRAGDKLQVQIVLKQEGQPLDLDSLAFWLVCPDAFRRLIFRWIEEHPQFSRIRGTYGYPDTSWTPEGDIRMPAIRSGDTWSDKDAKEWLIGTLTRQGVSLQA